MDIPFGKLVYRIFTGINNSKMKRTCQRWGFPALLMLIMLLSSCKAKYLELEARYQKARTKKTETEKENKILKAEIAQLSDSLYVVSKSWDNQNELHDQVLEIEGLKKEFLQKKVPFYLQMKNRQAAPAKPKKK